LSARATRPGGWLRHLTAWPLLWVLLAIILVVPTACFLVLAVSPRLFGQGPSWFTLKAFGQAFTGPNLHGMLNSVLIGIAAALLATAVAAGLAWVAQRTELPGRRGITLGLWAVLLVPTYVTAVGWEQLFEQGGVFANAGIVPAFAQKAFFGPIGVALILAFKGVPFAYFALAPALAGLGRSFEEAARVHGANRFGTLRTVAPILLPAIFAACTIVFAESISDFGVASTLAVSANFPVATYTIYSALTSFPANFPVAAVVGWMLVAAVAVALVIQNLSLHKRSYAVLSGRTRPAARQHPRGWPLVGTMIFVYGFFGLTLVVPAIGALVASVIEPFTSLSFSHLTFSAYSGVLHASALGPPILLSLKMATVNATLTLLIGLAVARALTSPHAGITGKLIDIVLVGSVALPGLVLAAGYLFAFNLPVVFRAGIHLYGTLFLLGMAYLAGALPTNSRVMIGPLAQLQGSLMHAGRVHGANQLSSFRRCVLPLLARSLLWAWLLTFAGTFTELPASELLAPTGIQTIATSILKVFNKSDLVGATALSVVEMVIVLGVIVVATVAFRLLTPTGWRRVSGELA
jgi:iron(III) transport system permease protein